MNDPDRPALRELLHTELRADEDRAPDFDTVWVAAAARHHRERTRSILGRIGGLAAVLAFVFLVGHAVRPAKNPQAIAITGLPWRSTVLLTEWRAPTDALLPAAEPFRLHN
jgi:type VI protein secretion system component VasF